MIPVIPGKGLPSETTNANTLVYYTDTIHYDGAENWQFRKLSRTKIQILVIFMNFQGLFAQHNSTLLLVVEFRRFSPPKYLTVGRRRFQQVDQERT